MYMIRHAMYIVQYTITVLDVQKVIRIQAHIRGYLGRKKTENKMKDVTISQYQKCCAHLESEIQELRDVLRRVNTLLLTVIKFKCIYYRPWNIQSSSKEF